MSRKRSSPRRPSVKLRLTLDGAVFALIAAAVGFAAFNTGASLLYLVFAMMLAFFVVSAFAASWSLKGLEVRRRLAGRAFARRPADVSLEVKNRKRFLASYSLRLTDELADPAAKEGVEAAGSAYVFALAPGETKKASYKAVFPRRGEQELSGVEVATRYPFGFLERRLGLPLAERFVVYPEVRGFREPPSSALNRPGQTERRERGEGVDLRSLRDYDEQDSARRIVWKISARVNRLIVAETERDAETRRRFALDNRHRAPLAPEAAERFELAVSFLASVAAALCPKGETVAVHTPQGSIEAGSGRDLDRLLRALALIEPRPLAEDEAERWALPPDSIQILYADEPRVSSDALKPAEWIGLLALRDDERLPSASGPAAAEDASKAASAAA